MMKIYFQIRKDKRLNHEGHEGHKEFLGEEKKEREEG